ncbi:hypothetical protein [Niveibacterium sp. COAC-50]|uniref:hypothetical protein n=1 Tax=Niveibacterium sp. COAC-50 TaxID=2729384 RepID=UPI00155451E2|nr:hypothetical protein [Niveibacterium sp. COAC-50]
MSDSELESAIARFLGAYEVVFDIDWEYSRELMQHDMANVIGSEATFARPAPGFENKNWGARTALIRAHQELVSLLSDRGVSPDVPVRDACFNFGWPRELKAGVVKTPGFTSMLQGPFFAFLRRLGS